MNEGFQDGVKLILGDKKGYWANKPRRRTQE